MISEPRIVRCRSFYTGKTETDETTFGIGYPYNANPETLPMCKGSPHSEWH